MSDRSNACGPRKRLSGPAKQYLHDLPDGAQLRVVEAKGGDLADIRAAHHGGKGRNRAGANGSRCRPMILPSGSRRYVADLAARARPVISGIGDGQSLSVHYPLRPDADRITLSGFSDFEANALLLAAFMDGERLAERLLETALDGTIYGRPNATSVCMDCRSD